LGSDVCLVRVHNIEFCYKLKKKKEKKRAKAKAIPLTGCGGPRGGETLRLPHFVDSWLMDGGEVASLTFQPPYTAYLLITVHGICLIFLRSMGHSHKV
jgi:hypothetical protein